MPKLQIGTNGFGIVGSLVLRDDIDHSELEKVLSWYDDEWGYSMRVLDLMVAMGQKDGVLS